MMGKMVYAQWRKSKGTWLVPFALGLPFFYGALAVGYFALPGRADLTLSGLVGFCVLFHIAVQFSGAVWIAAHVDLDRQAGEFANECRWWQHRVQTVLAKFLTYTLLLAVITGMSACSFLLFLNLFQMETSLALLQHLVYPLSVSSFFMLPLLMVYLWSAYALGMSGTLLLSAFMILSGVIFGTTGLGYVLWRFLPMSWGLKWLTDFGEGAAVPLVTLSLIAATCGFVVCLGAVVMWWFSQWDGQSRWDA